MAVTQLSLLGMIPVELFQPVCERLAGAAHDGEAFRRETSVYRKGQSAQDSQSAQARLRAYVLTCICAGVAGMTDHGLVAEENVLYLGQLRTASHQRTAWYVLLQAPPLPRC